MKLFASILFVAIALNIPLALGTMRDTGGDVQKGPKIDNVPSLASKKQAHRPPVLKALTQTVNLAVSATKQRVGKLAPKTRKGRVALAAAMVGAAAVLAAVAIVNLDVCSSWLTGSIVPQTVGYMEISPTEITVNGLGIGPVEPLPALEVLGGHWENSMFCGACFERGTHAYDIADYCARVYQNFAGDQCPEPSILDAEPWYRGRDALGILRWWGYSYEEAKRYAGIVLDKMAAKWIKALEAAQSS